MQKVRCSNFQNAKFFIFYYYYYFYKLEDSKPRIIQTIEKIYDYSYYTQKRYISERCH